MYQTPWKELINTLAWGIILLSWVIMSHTHIAMNQSESTERCLHKNNILVWNVQGAGNKEFLNILREHIRMHKPSVIGLVETRISGRKAQEVCDKIGFTNCFRVVAQGFQGGIWVLWNSHEIVVEVVFSHDQFVTVEITPPNNRRWFLTVVYASPHAHMRETLWQELQRCAAEYC